MSYYERHLFVCVNQREDGSQCCAQHDAEVIRLHAKRRLKALGRLGPGQLRVNRSGCLDRCSEGPVAVVYPDAVWYTYDDTDDIDEIIDEHLLNGRIVERLRLPD
ncbi:MAG: (2Fe-2S) ferredoxin domain-containing protein [Gammaproteobacteria bacterium]